MKKFKVSVPCKFCRTTHVIEVTEDSFAEWNSPDRRNIQFVFPYLSASERELLISGMCDKCWDETFSEKE